MSASRREVRWGKMTGSSTNEMIQGVTSGVRGDGRKHTVHWFRKGLRLHDNPSLREGLAGASTFRCVFVLDPWFAGSTNVGINKWRWATADIFRRVARKGDRSFLQKVELTRSDMKHTSSCWTHTVDKILLRRFALFLVSILFRMNVDSKGKFRYLDIK